MSVRLQKSGSQLGAPQQHSAVPGTKVELRGAPSSGVAAASTRETLTTTPPATTTAKPPATTTAKAPAKTTTKAPATTTPPATTTTKPPATTTAKAPATTVKAPVHHTVTVAAPKKTAKPPVTTTAPKPATPVAAKAPAGTVPFSARPPAFLLPGNAHRERAGELPLPSRAALLKRFVHAHGQPTNAAVKHWLVQHAWITAGARFGWWHGAQALQTLIATDRLVEATWGIGYRSESVARAALAYVHGHEVNR